MVEMVWKWTQTSVKIVLYRAVINITIQDSQTAVQKNKFTMRRKGTRKKFCGDHVHSENSLLTFRNASNAGIRHKSDKKEGKVN